MGGGHISRGTVTHHTDRDRTQDRVLEMKPKRLSCQFFAIIQKSNCDVDLDSAGAPIIFLDPDSYKIIDPDPESDLVFDKMIKLYNVLK